jgi:hypothetical protein
LKVMTRNKEAPSKRNRIICNYCKSQGHKAKECAAKNTGEPRTPGRPKRVHRGLIDAIECNYCGRTGHSTVNCQLRRQALADKERDVITEEEKFWSDSPPGAQNDDKL